MDELSGTSLPWLRAVSIEGQTRVQCSWDGVTWRYVTEDDLCAIGQQAVDALLAGDA